MWVGFNDNHTGSEGRKTEWEQVFIEALSVEGAVQIFSDRFDRHPGATSCDCCGPDYSITEYDDLKELIECNTELESALFVPASDRPDRGS